MAVVYPKRGQRTEKHIGKKAPETTAKREPKPHTAKAGSKAMGEMMHSKVSKTHAMKTTKNKGAKKY